MTNQEFIESIALEGEEWRDVVGYEGLYMVSSLGRVCSLARLVKNRYSTKFTTQRILAQTKRKCRGNYTLLEVKLCKDNVAKTITAHKIIATAFLPNPNNLTEIDHIDTNPQNNIVSNLQWVSRKENCNNQLTLLHIGQSKRGNKSSSKPIVQIRNNEVVKVFKSATEASRCGYCRPCVIACCKNRRDTYKGDRWLYLKDYETLNQ